MNAPLHPAASSATRMPHAAPIAVTPEPADEAGRFANALDLITAQGLALLAMIDANFGVMRRTDKVGQTILAGLNGRGRRFIDKIDAEVSRGVIDGPFGTAGRFGDNGHAPAIRALIRESERQRELATGGRAAA